MINQKDQKGLTRKLFGRSYGVALVFFVFFCAKQVIIYTKDYRNLYQVLSKDFYDPPLRRSVIITSIKYLAQLKINCVINQSQFKYQNVLCFRCFGI